MGNVRSMLFERRRVGGYNFIDDFIKIFAFKGTVSSQQLIEHNAKRKDVAALIYPRIGLCLFRGYIIRGPESLGGSACNVL